MSSRHLSVDDPENWVKAEDPETGRPYWVNQRTRETSWTPPGTAPGEGEEWVEAFDANSQRNYYVNKRTKRSTWSRPMLGQLASIERFFHYIDKKGNEQGPFTESKMREWYDQGYFKPHVKCKCDSDSSWSTIGALFGKEEDQEDPEDDAGSDAGAGAGGSGESKVSTTFSFSTDSDDAETSEIAAFSKAVKKVNSEITGVYRMTQLASQQAQSAAAGEAVNTKRGVLSVQESGVFGGMSWCERYFVLEGAKLSWYDDESHAGGKARGLLVLKPTSVAVTADDGSGADNLFKVTGDG